MPLGGGTGKPVGFVWAAGMARGMRRWKSSKCRSGYTLFAAALTEATKGSRGSAIAGSGSS